MVRPESEAATMNPFSSLNVLRPPMIDVPWFSDVSNPPTTYLVYFTIVQLHRCAGKAHNNIYLPCALLHPPPPLQPRGTGALTQSRTQVSLETERLKCMKHQSLALHPLPGGINVLFQTRRAHVRSSSGPLNQGCFSLYRDMRKEKKTAVRDVDHSHERSFNLDFCWTSQYSTSILDSYRCDPSFGFSQKPTEDQRA